MVARYRIRSPASEFEGLILLYSGARSDVPGLARVLKGWTLAPRYQWSHLSLFISACCYVMLRFSVTANDE